MDKTIRLWSIQSGENIHTFKGHSHAVTTVTVTPDGKYIVSGSLDKTIRLWSLKSRAIINTFKKLYLGVISIVVTPDGRYILSVSMDETIRLWSLSSGKEIHFFERQANLINTIAMTPNGKYIVSGDTHGTISVWSMKSGNKIYTFHKNNKIIKKSFSGKTSVSITPDSKYIVSTSVTEKNIKLWSMETREEINIFKRDSSTAISAVTITPDGKHIISGNEYGTIKLWSLKSGKEIVQFVNLKDEEWISSTPDGYYNCSNGALSYVKFLDETGETTKVLPQDHPIYKERKRKKLLSL